MAAVPMIPQLIPVLASTGLVPAQGFPEWAQPFVRSLPISVFTDAQRGLAAGADPEPTAVLTWTAGLRTVGLIAVFGPIAVRGYRRAAEKR